MTKSFPQPYHSQFALAGETYSCYGSDFRGCVTYTFNNQGYRSDFDYELEERDPLLLSFGSSIATGHGLAADKNFGALVAKQFDRKFWNLGQGCMRSSNQTILEQIEFLVDTALKIDYVIIQFTHINRQGSRLDSYLELDQSLAIKNFCAILQRISELLQDRKWCWLLLDWSGAVFPTWIYDHHAKIAIDPDSVDHISAEGYENLAPTQHAIDMLSVHPGELWHARIADQIISFFHGHQ
jgi:lysophospholipase L1-like esterase